MAIDAGLERLRHAVLEKGAAMIVGSSRGRGSGAGPVDYLLGKRPPARQRRSAGSRRKSGSLSTPRPMQKYTSGVLSFSEQDLPPGQRES